MARRRTTRVKAAGSGRRPRGRRRWPGLLAWMLGAAIIGAAIGFVAAQPLLTDLWASARSTPSRQPQAGLPTAIAPAAAALPTPAVQPPSAAPRPSPAAQPTTPPGTAPPATSPATPTARVAVATATSTPAPTTRPSAPGHPTPAAAGPEVSVVTTDRPVVALTFDAGAALGSTEETLQVLRSRGVRATFFITGQFAEKYPAAIEQMVADGHEISNHTYTHPDLATVSDQTIVEELERTDQLLTKLTGRSSKPWMRMPFGSRDARVLRVVGAAGYRSIYWALDSADWREAATAAGVAQRVLSNVEAGDVVVHHCSTAATAEALPAILDGLEQRGLRVVTVTELLRS